MNDYTNKLCLLTGSGLWSHSSSIYMFISLTCFETWSNSASHATAVYTVSCHSVTGSLIEPTLQEWQKDNLFCANQEKEDLY